MAATKQSGRSGTTAQDRATRGATSDVPSGRGTQGSASNAPTERESANRKSEQPSGPRETESGSGEQRRSAVDRTAEAGVGGNNGDGPIVGRGDQQASPLAPR